MHLKLSLKKFIVSSDILFLESQKPSKILCIYLIHSFIHLKLNGLKLGQSWPKEVSFKLHQGLGNCHTDNAQRGSWAQGKACSEFSRHETAP